MRASLHCRWTAATVLTLAALSTLTACGGPSPTPTAQAYLAAWSAGRLSAAAARTDDPAAATRALTATKTALGVTGMTTALGKVTTHGHSATARFTATVDTSVGRWRYAGALALRTGSSGRWQIHWQPQDIHPALTTPTAHLTVTRELPPRAALEAADGTPIFTEQPVVQVGIEPSRLKGQLHQTMTALAAALQLHDTAGISAAVRRAAPDAFVPVITLRRAAYEQVKPRIYSLPGTVFLTSQALLPPTTGFARALLGTVGPATADVLKALGRGYAANDDLGLSGLQAVENRRLAGTASGSIQVSGAGSTRTLATFDGTPGRPVRTTLDIRTQLAAEEALAHETKPAALVAVRAGDGSVLAVANTPDATSYDRALDGRYPPGSTFKVVTTYALLGAGVTPGTSVPCTPTITVNGKTFHNFEGEASAGATFADDFAQSCNSAFVRASQRLKDGDLVDAATALGVGAHWSLPLPSYSGSIPSTADPVERAADAIGQGQVLVSPLTMALAAAAVGSGHLSAPVLVTDPPQPSIAAAQPLDRARLATLRGLMRSVATHGTAAGAHLPSGTYGKTGTAEYGAANPPPTHAWFIGFRHGIAFAVLVEGGGVGGQVAAPIAAQFLRRLG